MRQRLVLIVHVPVHVDGLLSGGVTQDGDIVSGTHHHRHIRLESDAGQLNDNQISDADGNVVGSVDHVALVLASGIVVGVLNDQTTAAVVGVRGQRTLVHATPIGGLANVAVGHGAVQDSALSQWDLVRGLAGTRVVVGIGVMGRWHVWGTTTSGRPVPAILVVVSGSYDGIIQIVTIHLMEDWRSIANLLWFLLARKG